MPAATSVGKPRKDQYFLLLCLNVVTLQVFFETHFPRCFERVFRRGRTKVGVLDSSACTACTPCTKLCGHIRIWDPPTPVPVLPVLYVLNCAGIFVYGTPPDSSACTACTLCTKLCGHICIWDPPTPVPVLPVLYVPNCVGIFVCGTPRIISLTAVMG